MDWVWGDDARVVSVADHSVVAFGSAATKEYVKPSFSWLHSR